MQSMMIRLAMLACCCLLLAQQTHAAGKTFAVVPFEVQAPEGYSYLGKAVASTLKSRLSSSGEAQAIGSGLPSKAPAAAQIPALRKSLKADYLVYGHVAVLGNDCTVTANVLGPDGKTWTRDAGGPLSGLTATVSTLADAAALEGMRLSTRPLPAGAQTAPRAAQGPAGIVMNDDGTKPADYYLNPQFRYQGGSQGDGSRLHSQKLKFDMVDMAVGDFTGDGRNEIAILGQHKLYMYRMTGARLEPLGEITTSMSNDNFSMRAIDLNRDKVKELVVATFENDGGRAASYIYSFKGKKFSQIGKKSPYFLSVVKLPPYYEETLVGQAWDGVKLFRPGVYTMKFQNGEVSKGQRISLPDGGKVFGFGYMQPGAKDRGEKLLMYSDEERIKVFNSNGTLMHTTAENYSGASAGIDYYKTMEGLGTRYDSQLSSKYFSPMRFINFVDAQGDSMLLVNRPISTASMLFDRYRYFPQGEIHALYWDGVGMALKWKTRRIKGSVTCIDMADVNNDGTLDLVVGLNTSPSLGIGGRQSMVVAYPLDFTMSNANAPVARSEFEEPGK